jgi:hypothetical protein
MKWSTWSILRRIIVDSHWSIIIFGEKSTLNLPLPLFCANAELEIFLGNRVPILRLVLAATFKTSLGTTYLIDHHDRKEIADGCKEERIQVV